MCNKVINFYPSAIKFVPKRYRTQEMCAEVINTCPFVFDYVPDQFQAKLPVFRKLSAKYLC